MHQNEHLVHDFYTCFQKLDADGMVKCYAPDIEFYDPVFEHLYGKEVGAMWHMLKARAKNFSLKFRDIRADANRGSAHWEATYTFSKTGRMVTNVIDAKFQFRDGRIVDHRDSFGFWRWSRQALGSTGFLLGWSPMVRKKVRAEARKNLDEYIAANSK